MILSAGDLGIEIDYGPDKPGAILQRKEKSLAALFLAIKAATGWF